MEVKVLKDCVLGPRYLRAGQRVDVDMEPDKLPECLEPVRKAGGKKKNAASAATESGEEGGAAEGRPKI